MSKSTSAGRKNLGLVRTRTAPFWSVAMVSTPSPDPCQVHTDMRKSEGNHVADAVGASCGNDVVARFVLLEHAPLHFDVIACKTPVPLGVNVANPQALVKAVSDAGGGHRYLSCHEFKAATWAFVVEKNARAGEHVVRLSVVASDFEGEHFGTAVG